MTVSPFDLNLRHLRAVCAIAGHGRMTAAAAVVNLSQPALAQGIAKLEAQLGVALFTRWPGGMTATEAGLVLAERTEAAFVHLAAGPGGSQRFTRPEWLMTATQLRAFLSLAEAGSFVGAAAAIGLSQPAIHRAVRDLEQICGIVLVDRRGRGVAMSDAGQRLARSVRLARAEWAAAIAEITCVDGGDIAIGAMPLSRAMLVPRAIAQVASEMPSARFEVVEGSWRELAETLRDGTIDLMIGALRPEPGPPDLAQEALMDDQLVVVARAGHPLAGARAPSKADLARYPWIIGQAGAPLRGLWQDMFGSARLPPAPIHCGSVMVIRGVLMDSDFLTLLSPQQVALEIAAGVLTTIGSQPNASGRVIGITTRRDWRPTRVQARFLDALRQAASEPTHQDFEYRFVHSD